MPSEMKRTKCGQEIFRCRKARLSTHVITYWLIPARPTREIFVRAICELATRLGAPEFEPHLTLFVAPANSRPAGEVLREIEARQIVLAGGEIGFSEKFTKTLFVQFEKTNALQELANAIWKLSGAGKRPDLDPHLSLLYKRLPVSIKRSLAEGIRLRFGKVSFDSICAIHCPSPTKNAADIRRWRIIASSRLLK